MTNAMAHLQGNGLSISPKINVENLNAEIHIWRMRVAVVWSVIIQLLMFVTYILLISADPFHPFSWIANCFSVFLSLSLWLKLVVLVLTIYLQGEVCKRDYVIGPAYHVTRFQKIRHIFCVRNILLMLLHIIIGITVFCIYSSIPDNTTNILVKPCDNRPTHWSKHADSCLREDNLFLLIGGIWIGIFYFISDYMFGSRNLLFPLIQQYKFYRVKAALKDNFKHSLNHSVMPTVIFLVIYYVYGGTIRGTLIEFLSLKMDKEPIDSIQGLFNIRLIFFLWLFSSIFTTGLHTMELLFNVHLTEHCTFPVSKEMSPSGNYMRLVDSLKKTDVPIIHHLGYLDLFILSTKSRQRREEIFTLSHPGGHPHDWNSIHKECISLIKVFTSDLNQALQQEGSSKKEAPNKQVEVTGFHFHSHNIRKLASPMGVKMVGERTMEAQSAVEIVFNNVQNWVNAKLDQLYKKPYVAYFFGESQDTRINYLLCKSQPVIWAVQGIAFLCAASLSEDRYGIVQKDLPEIIITLVNTKQVLDKLFKQNLIVKKTFAKDPLDVQMKYLLRSSVKRSLYLIAVTFGPYMQDLQIPVEIKVQLENFSAFKEI